MPSKGIGGNLADALQRDVYCLLGLPVDAVDMATAVARVRDAARRREPCFISTPNLNFLIGSRSDSDFRDSVIGSELSLADGMPLVWIARLLGIPLPERVAGSNLFEHLGKDADKPLTVFFFGGPQGAAEAAAKRLNAEPRGLACVGYDSPGFGTVEELSGADTIARINASGADLLVVALGAKKGQAWIERNRARLSVPAITHLGAVVNFVAGTVRRAPPWMQKSGLEWLWRVKEEPQLWRRYGSDGLALARLLVTRIVPYAWLLHQRKPARAELDACACRVRETAREIVVRLRGAWVRQTLAPLRECLSRVARTKKDVRVDLAHATYVDSAFLGLMLLFYGVQKANGRRLICSPVIGQVRRIFEYGCSEFLLAAEDETDAGTPAWSDLDEAELEDAGAVNG